MSFILTFWLKDFQKRSYIRLVVTAFIYKSENMSFKSVENKNREEGKLRHLYHLVVVSRLKKEL